MRYYGAAMCALAERLFARRRAVKRTEVCVCTWHCNCPHQRPRCAHRSDLVVMHTTHKERLISEKVRGPITVCPSVCRLECAAQTHTALRGSESDEASSPKQRKSAPIAMAYNMRVVGLLELRPPHSTIDEPEYPKSVSGIPQPPRGRRDHGLHA